MTATLESAGLFIKLRDLGAHHIDVLTQWPVDGPPLVIVSDRLTGDELRLALAHELGHLVMHSWPRQHQEEQAAEFATEFLLPEAEIMAPLDGLTARNLSRLVDLSHGWGVALPALLRRARDIGGIAERQYRNLNTVLHRTGMSTRGKARTATETPTLVANLIRVHQREHGYRVDDLAATALMTPAAFTRNYLAPSPSPLRPRERVVRPVRRLCRVVRPGASAREPDRVMQVAEESGVLTVATTALFVELVVIGVGAGAVGALVLASVVGWQWLGPVSRAGALVAFVGLPLAYVLGIVVDRLADSLGTAMSESWLRRVYPSEEGEREYKADLALVLSSSPLAARLIYGRSRLRVCRGWSVDGLFGGVALAGYVLSSPAGQPRLGVAVGGGLALAFLVAGCLFAWKRLAVTQCEQVRQEARGDGPLPE